MTERIYTRDPRGRLEPLEGERVEKEDELQALIAEHLELLDGRQMRPEDPLRWILIAREQGIAESADSAARWAVDHLLADQDAVPTLVEVKRGRNPEIRTRRTLRGRGRRLRCAVRSRSQRTIPAKSWGSCCSRAETESRTPTASGSAWPRTSRRPVCVTPTVDGRGRRLRVREGRIHGDAARHIDRLSGSLAKVVSEIRSLQPTPA